MVKPALAHWVYALLIYMAGVLGSRRFVPLDLRGAADSFIFFLHRSST